jgi:hypothetical protein
MSQPDWRKALVVFYEATDVPNSLPRSERHRIRLAAAQEKRTELLDRLESAGLSGEVEVPEATPSKSILIEASPRALEVVSATPVVEKVLPIAEDASMGLIE